MKCIWPYFLMTSCWYFPGMFQNLWGPHRRLHTHKIYFVYNNLAGQLNRIHTFNSLNLWINKSVHKQIFWCRWSQKILQLYLCTTSQSFMKFNPWLWQLSLLQPTFYRKFWIKRSSWACHPKSPANTNEILMRRGQKKHVIGSYCN